MDAPTAAVPLATRPLKPDFGVEISGVDLLDADQTTLGQVAMLLYRHGAIVVRGQSLDPAAQVAFTRTFGAPAENHHPQWCVAEHPEVFIISNKVVDGRRIGEPAAGQNWHTDLNYHRRPALCTILHALDVPKEGSDTLLADVCAAWNALPQERQDALDGLKVRHSFAKLQEKSGLPLSAKQEADLPDVVHPLVRRHTHDGRKALYLGSTRVVRGIEGMPEEEGLALISELIAFATQEQFVYRHKWQVGDVLVWDNRCTLHRGTPFDMENDVRHIHRTWVRGEAPV